MSEQEKQEILAPTFWQQVFDRQKGNKNFLSVVDDKWKFRFGVIMWASFYIGYLLFCLNWLIFDKLGGDASGNGWVKYFQSDSRGLPQQNLELLKDAVNYGITFARGLVTVAVAWLMVKLSHKNAGLIAFALNTIALPLLYSPHYVVLVLGRMCMAAGGTMLIILIQPVISRFFTPKQKGVLSAITPTAYLLAGLTVCLVFLYKGSNDAVIKALQQNWRTICLICAGLTYIPLIAYLVFGKNFTTADNEFEEVEQAERPENTYAGIIKEKSCWFWIFFYSFLLVGSLLVSFKAPKLIGQINPQIINTAAWNIDWTSAYTGLFYIGCLFGMMWGKWAKTQYRRKPIVALCCSVGLLCWAGIFGGAHISNTGAATLVIFYSVFFFAFFAMGIQSIILHIPHEYKENSNSKRLTIFYSYLWGIGYIIYTVYQIIIAACISSSSGGAGAGAGGAGASNTGAYVAMGLITFFLLMFAVFSFTIKEPKPEYDFFPGLVQASDLWNKEQRLANKRSRMINK